MYYTHSFCTLFGNAINLPGRYQQTADAASQERRSFPDSIQHLRSGTTDRRRGLRSGPVAGGASLGSARGDSRANIRFLAEHASPSRAILGHASENFAQQ